jgi:hypothetical protein
MLSIVSSCAISGNNTFNKENNERPIAIGQCVSTLVNTPVTITLHSYSADSEIQSWSISANPLHGSISSNYPKIVYTPFTDYTGIDNLTFQVSDGILFSNNATITINVKTTGEVFNFSVPDGRIIHGLGQYVPSSCGYSDEENWQHVKGYESALGMGMSPVIYSVYLGICPEAVAKDNTNIQDIATKHDYPYILVISLYLLDQTKSKNVRAILSGDWDDSIRTQASSIKALDSVVFIRPGFEFGASSGVHGEFNATEFIAIWHYIRNIFSEEGVSKALWIWDTVNPETFSYMDYYPGDEVVDWWGINYFTIGQMSGSAAFIDAANTHGKPVMICESSPILNNGTQNTANWNNWFVPYFNIIKQKNIKAFIYINDPWDKEGFWEEWADSQIYSNSTICNNYLNEMQNDCYIHMVDYLANPNIFNPN